MKEDDEIGLTTQKLKWLKLPGMAEQLRTVIAKAAKENLSVLQAVDRLCDEEKASRLRNAVNRRIHDAKFPEVNTVDAFDFDFCPVRKKVRAMRDRLASSIRVIRRAFYAAAAMG